MREIFLTLVIVTKQQSANVSVNGGPKTRAGVMVSVRGGGGVGWGGGQLAECNTRK